MKRLSEEESLMTMMRSRCGRVQSRPRLEGGLAAFEDARGWSGTDETSSKSPLVASMLPPFYNREKLPTISVSNHPSFRG